MADETMLSSTQSIRVTTLRGGRRSSWPKVLAALAAFALLAAACGSDSEGAGDDVDSDATTTTAADDSTDEPDDGETTTTVEAAAPESGTIEELEAVWATNRAGIIDTLAAGIDAGDYGVGDDGILRGPGGFEVDLGQCPDDWSDSGGFDDSEVRIGQSLVQSGPAAAAGKITTGMELYFDYVNSQGGIGGRDLAMNSKDDQYTATVTIENVNELIQNEDPFLLHLAGSPNVLATYDQINDSCIPNPLVATGHPAWGDPENHPWTTGGLFSYGTEAVMWGNWIVDNIDELPVVVGGAFIDNDFGLALELGFQEWADANPDVVSEFVPVRFDPAAPTVVNEMTTIAAADPQILVIGTTGVTCTQTIVEADRAGMKETLLGAFTTSVCKPIEANIGPAEGSADGWLVVGGGLKDTQDPNHVDEVFISWLNEQVTAAGEDPTISFIGTGYFFAWPMIEAMKIADGLPGGLSRSNYLLAMRSMKLEHPMVLDGIEFESNGTDDAYYIEGADISRFDADAQSWNVEGEIVDLNGNTANCAWNNDEGGCE